MSELTPNARETSRRVSRVMYPHDHLPDEAYDKVVRKLEADARGDDRIRATIEQGVADLDGSGAFVDLDADAQLSALTAAEGSDYFKLVQGATVVELYDNPLVWEALGYEGPSVHLGGYLHRGFDDLDWLPDPPVELDPTAGSHHS
jgi:hypothetical protein